MDLFKHITHYPGRKLISWLWTLTIHLSRQTGDINRAFHLAVVEYKFFSCIHGTHSRIEIC